METTGNENLYKVLYEKCLPKHDYSTTTKVIPVENCGVIVQVSTMQKNPDGSYSLAEALTYVPNACIVEKDGVTKIEGFSSGGFRPAGFRC